LFPQPTFDTAATEVPVPTSSPSSEFTDLFPQPSFVTTFPSEPTVTGSSTHLHPHVPISIGTKQPLGPGWSHSLPHQPLPPHNPTLPHKPYPTETYIGAWDPELPPISTAGSDGHQPLPPHKPTHPHKPYPTETYIGAWDPELPPVSTACSDGPPLPTTPSWTYEKRAEESISVHHIGPGWDHSLAHQPLPTTLATVILDESSAEESTSVHHVGPGWDHSLAHQPFPTTLATVVLEERNAEEGTFAHRVGPGWDHSLAHQPIPTRRARIVEKESVHHVGPVPNSQYTEYARLISPPGPEINIKKKKQ
ncbi:MAG: hypothetical protein L6R42_002394, partial [Xanthoria sp. 1 TBL-2021]